MSTIGNFTASGNGYTGQRFIDSNRMSAKCSNHSHSIVAGGLLETS